MAPGRLESGAMDLVHGFIERSALFYYLRVPTYWGAVQRMRDVLALRDGEWLHDVGCGTGMAAVLARGLYVGVDTTVPYWHTPSGGRLTRAVTSSP